MTLHLLRVIISSVPLVGRSTDDSNGGAWILCLAGGRELWRIIIPWHDNDSNPLRTLENLRGKYGGGLLDSTSGKGFDGHAAHPARHIDAAKVRRLRHGERGEAEFRYTPVSRESGWSYNGSRAHDSGCDRANKTFENICHPRRRTNAVDSKFPRLALRNDVHLATNKTEHD